MEDPNTVEESQQPFPSGRKKPHINFDEMLKKCEEATIQSAKEDIIRH